MILKQMGHEVRTQDNRITAEPIFVVQQKRRIYGMDPELGVSFEYLNSSGDVTDETDPDGERTAYIDIWEMVQPFFTCKGAEHYIEENRHHMTEPRIYVESAYRNKEWIAIREWLKTLDSAWRPMDVMKALSSMD
jgi:hypothetical protein